MTSTRGVIAYNPLRFEVKTKDTYTATGEKAVEVTFGEVQKWDSGGDSGYRLVEILPESVWNAVLRNEYVAFIEGEDLVIREVGKEVKCGYRRHGYLGEELSTNV